MAQSPQGSLHSGALRGARRSSLGDLFYADLRRPFTVGGMWGLRVLDPAVERTDLKKLVP
jgi:hypothetical protein